MAGPWSSATWSLAAVLALAGKAGAAQEAETVSATFTWNSLDLSTVELADAQVAYALESIVTVSPETQGPLARLSGRCIVSGVRDLAKGGYQGSGVCALGDVDGNRLVLRLAEGAGRAGEPPTGEGAWDGGTGRFDGVAGEFTYSLVSYGLQPPGVGQGTGRIEGTWVRAE